MKKKPKLYERIIAWLEEHPGPHSITAIHQEPARTTTRGSLYSLLPQMVQARRIRRVGKGLYAAPSPRLPRLPRRLTPTERWLRREWILWRAQEGLLSAHPPTELGLAYLRFCRNMTEEELAERSGVYLGTIRQIEQHAGHTIRNETITRLAAGLGCTYRVLARLLRTPQES